MKVAMVDPSLFMIPYDRALCAALQERGATVRLFGRPLRDGEAAQLHGRAVEPVFYRFAESRVMRRTRPRVRLAMKGFEHGASHFRLARELRAWRPDVIHFQWFPLPVIDRWIVQRLRKIAPVVATVHDSTPFNTSPSSRIQGMGAYEVISRCDRVIVHTQKAVSVLSGRGVAFGRIVRIPCGILEDDAGVVAPREKPAGASGKVRFLQFGILKPYKGIDILLRAIAALPGETRARCEFLIAGKPAMDVTPFEALRGGLGIEDCVRFDFRFFREEEMKQLLADADVLLFPYREIDASGVFYAALPYGKPVIATRIGVFQEMLVDGVHGILAEPDDRSGLSEAIRVLSEDHLMRAAMGEKVRSLCAEVAKWDDIAESTLAVYRLAVRGGAELHGMTRGLPSGDMNRS